MYKVFKSRFHATYAGETIYEGKSLPQAVRIARKNDCNIEGGCACGGPSIVEFDENGEEGLQEYFEWNTTPPFHLASEPFWG